VARILIVEDDEDTRLVLEETLQELGHVVTAANDGLSALELARTMRPEVAIVDIGLPKMDGYEIARRLRLTSEGGSMKLIALSGYGRENDRKRSVEAGFDVHLVKPASVDVIADHCRTDGDESRTDAG
jgi:CheY-like chemotaxis protein